MSVLWSLLLAVALAAADQLEPPSIQPLVAPKMIKEQQKLKISCSLFSGSPPIAFDWLKNGEPIQPNERLSVKQTSDDISDLIFRRVQFDDSGSYSCRAANPAGRDQSSVKIQVRGECGLCWQHV